MPKRSFKPSEPLKPGRPKYSSNSDTPMGKLRVSRGYSQEEVGKHIGVRGKYPGLRISAYELGRQLPTDRHIEMMADLFQVPLANMRHLCGVTFRDGALNQRNAARLVKYDTKKPLDPIRV